MVVTVPETMLLYWSSVPGRRGWCVTMATERGVCWAGTPGTPIDSVFAVSGARRRLSNGLKAKIFVLCSKQRMSYSAIGGKTFQFSCHWTCTVRHFKLWYGKR